jgi:cathepsin A (carboxypeptidase C)
MDRFLRQFMTAFPARASRDFYIAGESYGGSWVPVLAATILESQANGNGLEVQGSSSRSGSASSLNPPPSQPTINLKGVMMGSGLIRRSIQNLGFFEMACSGPESLLDSSECRRWAPRAMWCEKNLGICESEGMKSPSSKEAEDKCSAIGQVITGEKHRNPYDIRLRCDGPEACYTEMQAIDEYLNQDAVKEALGVPVTEKFQGISLNVFKQWEELGDLWRASDDYVNYLLESVRSHFPFPPSDYHLLPPPPIRFVYRHFTHHHTKPTRISASSSTSATKTCTATRQACASSDHGLDWHGQPFIRFRGLVPWYVGAKVAGRWKAYEPLTYAEIADAGHLEPFDRPLESLTLINAWIQGRMPVL